MVVPKQGCLARILAELNGMCRQVLAVWRLVSWRHRAGLGGALLIMSLASGASTAIALCLGWLIDAVNPQVHPGQSQAALTRVATVYLG